MTHVPHTNSTSALRAAAAATTRLTATLATAAMAAVATLAALPAAAQPAYPTQTVRILVGSPPGAPSDIITRLVADQLSQRWKQPVVVENRAGAGNNIAAQQAARATPDGHTLLITPDTVITVNPLLYRKMDFDPRTDLLPISVLASFSQVLVCNTALGIDTVPQLIERTRQAPMTYASGGAGVPGHLAAEMFIAATGITMTHVPYRGPSPALTDVLGGQVDCGFLTGPTVLPHVQTGKLKALAVSSARPSSLAPELPSLAHVTGVAGLDATFNQVLMAPKGTPDAVLAEIESAAVAALADPTLRERLAAVDMTVRGTTATEAAATLKTDIARWGDVVRRIDLQLD
jgi:tripartite-type tricarboxylate transporter receptor subunit TctC